MSSRGTLDKKISPARNSGRGRKDRFPLLAADRAASRLDVHRIKRRAPGHEQPVATLSAPRDVGNDLRHANLADARAVGRKDEYAVVPVADPSHAGPHVAVLVAADAVGETGLTAHRHLGEELAVLELLA